MRKLLALPLLALLLVGCGNKSSSTVNEYENPFKAEDEVSESEAMEILNQWLEEIDENKCFDAHLKYSYKGSNREYGFEADYTIRDYDSINKGYVANYVEGSFDLYPHQGMTYAEYSSMIEYPLAMGAGISRLINEINNVAMARAKIYYMGDSFGVYLKSSALLTGVRSYQFNKDGLISKYVDNTYNDQNYILRTTDINYTDVELK